MVMTNSLLLNMVIEIVDLRIDSMVIFQLCKRLPEGIETLGFCSFTMNKLGFFMEDMNK